VSHIIERRYSEVVYPLHAILLAGTLPFFLGALLSDIAYAKSYNIQWQNFASWFLVGGLIFAGVALVFAIVDLFQTHRRVRGIGVYFLILLVTWVVGFFDALMHARDAWAGMPGGLILSAIVTLLACVAIWFGFCTPRIGGTK
jgi:uncharacterized membrane protein